MNAPDRATTAVEPGRPASPQSATRPWQEHGSDHEGMTARRLSTRHLNVMRVGYAFMGVGLAIVKWPLLTHLESLPVMDGVVTCLLTAMSLLALLGLRYPARMLPILLFEVVWKTIWIAAVAVPHLVADDLDAATREVLISCSAVVVIAAVIPWGFAWRQYARTPGNPWR